EREQQVVARDTGDLLRLETEELCDAVVLVHDVVAGTQVGEALQRAPRRRGRARRPLPKDLGVREQREADVAPDEAPAGGRDRERKAGRSVSRLEHRRLDATQQLLLAQRLASVRKGDDDVELLPQQPTELVLGLGQATGGERGPLRVE